MNTRHLIFIALGFVVLVSVCAPIAWRYHQKTEAREETLHMDAAYHKLVEKLEAYRKTNGRFPDSMDALSFTNSLEEIQMLPDIRKINYRCLQNGGNYGIFYTGVYGYRIAELYEAR